jgi:hypothetical protein
VWILEAFQLCTVTLPLNVAPLVLLKLPTLLPLTLGLGQDLLISTLWTLLSVISLLAPMLLLYQ